METSLDAAVRELALFEAAVPGGLVQLVEEKPAGPASAMTVPLSEATNDNVREVAPLSLVRNSNTGVVRMIPGSGGVHIRADGTILFKLSVDGGPNGQLTTINDIMNDYDQAIRGFLTDGARRGAAASGLTLNGVEVVMSAEVASPIARVRVGIGVYLPPAPRLQRIQCLLDEQRREGTEHGTKRAARGARRSRTSGAPPSHAVGSLAKDAGRGEG